MSKLYRLVVVECMLLLSLLLSLPSHATSNTVELSEERNFLELLEIAETIVVADNAQLRDVQQMSQWQQGLVDTPVGLAQALWFRVTLQYVGGKSRYAFVIGNPHLDYVDLYLLDERGRILESVMTGGQRNQTRHIVSYQEHVVFFDLENNEQVTVVARIKDQGPVVFDARVWRLNALVASEQANYTYIGMFSGALAVLACYFLITYVLLRSPVRFWFAVANLVFAGLFLNAKGILSDALGHAEYMSAITLILVASALFCAAKVSHGLLHRIPVYWRYATYGCAIFIILLAVTPSSYWQVVFAAAASCSAVLMQLLLTLRYRNPFNSLPNKLYAAGLITISVVIATQAYWFLQGVWLNNDASLVMSFVLLLGVILAGVAIEAHENVLVLNQQEQQRNAISDLRRFYDFYRNSAEGLFTATYDGELITVNPAMCHLFRFEDEQALLQEKPTLNALFVDEHGRDLLYEQLDQESVVVAREARGIRADGNEFWMALTVQLREENAERLLFGSIVDITERKQSDISLAYLASHDPLTGIYNRHHFEAELTSVLREHCHTRVEVTLLYIDLDQFKAVNDSSGHKAGDMLLKGLAQKLYGEVRSQGVLGRMGGDEFAVLLQGEYAQQSASIAANLLHVITAYRFVWEGRLFSVGASIGIVKHSEHITSSEQLMSMADSACYVAKEQGRNKIHQYSSDDEQMQRYEMELNWLSHINEALDTGNFCLYFQAYKPLHQLSEGYRYELLVRMLPVDGDVILPGSFLPAAERYKLITKIDRWVIENYFIWLSQNPKHLANLECCNINLSGQSLGDNELKRWILNAFEQYDIPYHKICFEITESMAIIRLDDTLRFIDTFRQQGCKFALDDFGVGFSSYEYLKNLPVDVVKIDGSFVKNILNDPIDMAMVSSMRDVAKAMGMETVAEYVESSEIMVELGKIGIDYAQGYCIAKPEPLLSSYGDN